MAGRKFNGMIRTLHTEPCEFWVKFTVSAGSAVATQPGGTKTYCVISKPAGTGIYRATFTDAYQSVLFAGGDIIKAAGTFDGKIDHVASTNEATSTPLVVDFQTRLTSTGAAFDPTSVTILLHFVLKNSTVTL